MEWDFSKNAEIDEAVLSTAPEGYRGAYEKGDDGKYRISAASKPFVEAIVGLGTALRNERGVSRGLKGQKDVTEQLREALGFDTLEEAKAKFEELNGQVASASKVDPAKIKADIERTFNQAIAVKDAELGGMSKTLEKYMVENAAVLAVTAAKGNSTLLMPHIRDSVKLVKDGDDYVVRVLDSAGDYRGDGKGGFMDVAQYVGELKTNKTFAGAFESDNQGGSGQGQGVRPTGQQRTTFGAVSRDDMTPAQMMAKGLQDRGTRR